MSEANTVVVLRGGVVTARELRKHLARQHRVMLVEREREHLFAPSLCGSWSRFAEPMGGAGPEVSAAVKQRFEGKGIPYHPEHQVKAVDPAVKRLDFASGVSADFDLLAYVSPHRAPRVVRE